MTGDEDILRLDISMDNTIGMQMFNCTTELTNII